MTIGTRSPALDHRHRQISASPADNEGGQAPAGTEIDQRPRAGRDQVDEPVGVRNGIDQRPLTDRAASLNDPEGYKKTGVIRHSPA